MKLYLLTDQFLFNENKKNNGKKTNKEKLKLIIETIYYVALLQEGYQFLIDLISLSYFKRHRSLTLCVTIFCLQYDSIVCFSYFSLRDLTF